VVLNSGSVVFSCGCHENVGVGVTCDPIGFVEMKGLL
jgi:hypothetical protein